MLIKDEMKFEQKLNQTTTKDVPAKREAAGRPVKKKLIALREVRHMLDEVSTRRTILSRENEETRRAISSMRSALLSMPKAVQDERDKLMSRNRQCKSHCASSMINENIRESIYSMNITISSMPIMVAASTASATISQQVLCSTLLSTFQHHPCGQNNLLSLSSASDIPILPMACPSSTTTSAAGFAAMAGSGFSDFI